MMPQSVWCRITRCPLLGGWPWPSRPSRAHERSVAGVIRPPLLRIATPSPSSSPSTSLGSTRESTQPSTCRVSLVGKGRPANAPVAANAALRRTSSSEEMIMASEHSVAARSSLHPGRHRDLLQGLWLGPADRLQPRLAALGRRLGCPDDVLPRARLPRDRARPARARPVGAGARRRRLHGEDKPRAVLPSEST